MNLVNLIYFVGAATKLKESLSKNEGIVSY